MLANFRRELRLLLHNAFYVDRIVDRGHGAQCRMIKLGENSVCFHLWVLSYAVNGWDWTPYYVVLVEQNLPLRHILRRERFIEQRNYLLSVLEPRFGGNITRVVDQVGALDCVADPAPIVLSVETAEDEPVTIASFVLVHQR